MANVKFYRGLSGRYNATTHADGLFFSTDIPSLKVNNVEYGLAGAVVNIAYANRALKYTKGDGTQVDIPLVIPSTFSLGAKDNSIEVIPPTNGDETKVGVKLAPNGGIEILPGGLAIKASALGGYTGDNKSIVVNGDKSISLKKSTVAGNLIDSSDSGLFASVKLKRIDTDDTTISAKYGLVKVDSTGTETNIEGATIDILKDRFLKSVEIATIPEGKQDAGKDALKFTFLTSDGSENEQYISTSSLSSVIGTKIDVKDSGHVQVSLEIQADGSHKYTITENDIASAATVAAQAQKIQSLEQRIVALEALLTWEEQP